MCFTTTVAIAALRIAGKAELDSPRTTLTMRGDQVAVESLQLPRYEEDVGALNVARVLYSLLSIPLFMRLIQFLRYFKSVGVLSIVLAEMVKDVILFAIILAVTVSSFAVAFGTLLNDVDSQDEWYKKPLGLDPVWAPVWAVFGGLSKVGIAQYAKDMPQIIQRVAPFLLWTFAFVILILIRLLVAMLATTYGRIIKESEGFWLFERAQLISEYKDTKPPLPPPFNILWYLFYSLPRLIKSRARTDKSSLQRGFKRVPDTKMLKVYLKREQHAHQKCILMQQTRRAGTMVARSERHENSIKSLEEKNRARFEALNRRIDLIMAASDS
uniref:Ion transport domain-containing protein n=1 Tax=Haptolina ericina TaxID=156174 RepID=A0A7S3BUD2_9EUKA|mmetsp:Transcript_68251/g.152355  ORF Transcript_68251/g.152355 Transcript_68251/m.152355 type:complete len:327 (+) Transcript_68251:1-981(+)